MEYRCEGDGMYKKKMHKKTLTTNQSADCKARSQTSRYVEHLEGARPVFLRISAAAAECS